MLLFGNLRLVEKVKAQRQSQLARNASWLMVGQGLGLGLQALYFIFLARLLGTNQYGIFAGAFAFTNLLAQYGPVGSGTVFLRYVPGNPDRFAAFFGNILLNTLPVGGLLVAGLTISAHYVMNRESAHLVFLASMANCLFAQLTQELARIFQAFEKMRITAALNLSVSGIRALTVMVMYLILHHVTAFAWAAASTIVSAVAAAAALILTLQHFGKPMFSLTLARKNLVEGIGFAFASSTTSAYNDLDKTLLAHYGLNHDNGVYTMAYRLIDFSTMPIFSLRDAAVPKLFQLGHQGIHVAAAYGRRLRSRALLLGALASLGLFAIAPAISFIVGKGFAESTSAVRWLALIPLFRSIHQMNGVVLTSCGRQTLRTGAQLTSALFNFGLNIYLIPRHGWLGAAWASIATDGLLAILNTALLRIVIARNPAVAAA